MSPIVKLGKFRISKNADCRLRIRTKMQRLSHLRVMVLNATFNNISVRSWQSVFLVDEAGIPGETHRPAASH